jgi:tRNA(Ile)-lysidine synthase
VSAAEGPVTDAEADQLFADLAAEPTLVLAVSGGPDSTALMLLAARWAKRRKAAPRLRAVTIDHGLRPEARREAAAVKRLAAELGVTHRTLHWNGPKPTTGLQEKARAARYRLLHAAAQRSKARCVLTAHTLDDQAETVLFRMARGSGPAGLGAMTRVLPFAKVLSGETPGRHGAQTGEAAACATDPRARFGAWAKSPAVLPPADCERRKGDRFGVPAVRLVRPFLGITKARLIATLGEAGIAYAQDPSNDDPRFARARLRRLAAVLAAEGLSSERLALLAHRLRRSEAAIETTLDDVCARLDLRPDTGRIVLAAEYLRAMPAEIALRLLGRAVDAVGNEGPVELAKLEALSDALAAAMPGSAKFRRTLAGAMVSLQRDTIIIERAPARRHRPGGASREGVGASCAASPRRK